ncbi:LacI family DNA-binding transcriptional regulator [Micrococcaceae bacterium Sec5.1]
MKFQARMSDVAYAAGVGISTVSNVLNHPYKVAASTLERVERAIADLDFQRSEEAVKLRLGKRAKPNRSCAGGVATLTDSGPTATPGEAPGEVHAATPSPVESLSLGTRAEIVEDGRVVGSGIVDASMPDGSAVWLWMDCGGGRRLISSHDGLELRASQNHGSGPGAS